MQAQHNERIEVETDGEELTVYNWVNVTDRAVVRGHNPCVEKFDPDIGAGDSAQTPEAVTTWVAEELWHEFGIEVGKHGIEVVDVEANDVRRL